MALDSDIAAPADAATANSLSPFFLFFFFFFFFFFLQCFVLFAVEGGSGSIWQAPVSNDRHAHTPQPNP